MPADRSPTARALRTMEIIRDRPGVTADELATALGVTRRAARRYVGILREAGVPVDSARGPYGGYRLGRGARLPPVTFTGTEALGLVMAVLDGHPSAARPDDPVGAALNRIIRALPDDLRRPATALRQHAATVPDRFPPRRPDPTTTSDLVAAVADRQRLRVTYRSQAGEWETDVDPWAVVVRHGRWYLLCHSHRADAVRTYRIDRVVAVTPVGERFTPPADLDPVAVLEENLGTGWEFPTRVVFDRPVDEVAPYLRAAMGRLEPAPAGGCVLTGSTSDPAMYAREWLAGVPLPFRVEGGPDLRDAVAALAARLTAAVTEPDAERPQPPLASMPRS